MIAPILQSPALHRILGSIRFPNRLFRRVRPIRAARRILILKPDEIGDVILATGLFRTIRTQCLSAHITIALRPLCIPLIQSANLADDILPWDERWRSLNLGGRAWLGLIRTACECWRHRRPDWVLIPRSCGDHTNSAWYAWWSGGTHVCAHESFCTDWNLGRRPLVNDVIPTHRIGHELAFHRHMARHLGLDDSSISPTLTVPKSAENEASRVFVPNRDGAIALGIGAGSESRRWPEQKFRTLAQIILGEARPPSIYLIGAEHEAGIAKTIASGLGDQVVNTVGNLSLMGTAALLQRCPLFVGNDSGAMHLAASSGCAIVEISKHPHNGDDAAYTSPARFAPVAKIVRILRPQTSSAACSRECKAEIHAHCITNISVAEVHAALCEVRAEIKKQS